MKDWVVFAFLSMAFAGFTSVIAKKGLENISADLGLTVRTAFVFIFMMIFAWQTVARTEWSNLRASNWLWLGGSAFTTFLSWVFYYRAIKVGEVSTVALIDKGSIVIAVALAVIFLHEALTLPKLGGAALIVAGLLVIARG